MSKKMSKKKKSRKFLNWLTSKRAVLTLVFILAIGSVGFLKFVNSVNAQVIDSWPLTISYPGPGPIFTQTEYAPGATTTPVPVQITNKDSIDHSFGLATENITGDTTFASQLFIKANYNGNEVWSKSVSELATLPTESLTIVPTINPHDTVTVYLSSLFDPSAGNEYQDKSIKFDIRFGVQEKPGPEPTATATETSTTTATETSTATETATATGTSTATATETSTSTSTPTELISPTATTSSTTTGGAITVLGGVARFFAAGTAAGPVASASVSVSATASTTPLATATAGGEVKGAQTDSGSGRGLYWPILLITPAVAFLAFAIPAIELLPGVGLIAAGSITTAVLSFYTHGSLKPIIFWIILIIELIVSVIINYFLLTEYEEGRPRVRRRFALTNKK